MARFPDMIMVVRHGARLDAADPSWHLHSPTPYDSPLTYGGWNQSKLLGQRISAILKSGKYAGRPGRVRILMHSSPFLRCLQTSIGIAAGIAETSPDGTSKEQSGRDGLSPITEPLDENDSTESLVPFPLIEKPLLRVDAFLGEWLSPDYFDHITPPPDTPLMLLSAKAELLTEAVEEDLIANSHNNQQPPTGHFPGGWSGFGDGLTRQRSNSFSQGTPDGNTTQPNFSTPNVMPIGYYNPPVPTSAVSVSDHIPQGYVPHARETCLEVDMAWDSSKEPLHWGDGGQLGEEWGDLHRRFHRGLKNLVSWYKSSENFECLKAPLAENDLLVVILVTHSSGCNALIGALTNQPVLIDVGQASLTIATRKGESDQYDVGLKASTDHLRRKSASKAIPPKKGENKTPPSTTSTRHARSSSNSRRSSQTLLSQALPGRTSSIDGQQPFAGLWGKTNASGTSSPPRMWSIDKSGSADEQLEQPVFATDIDSEAGAPKVWSEQRAPAKRRWTTNEPTL